MHGDLAAERVVHNEEIETLLDVGCGKAAKHTRYFRKHGKTVTPVDIQPTLPDAIVCDYMKKEVPGLFDCVWACHILEHQPNPNLFLVRLHSNLKEGGWLAITAPPMRKHVRGGHISVWNAGLLLYHLVVAGFDCSDPAIKVYGYNCSIMVKKKTIDIVKKMVFDKSDIDLMEPYLPMFARHGFNGCIDEYNW